MICAGSIYAYMQNRTRYESPMKWRIERGNLYRWGALLLFVIVVFGWYATEHMGSIARTEVEKDCRSDAMIIAAGLKNRFDKADQMAKVISGSPWIYPLIGDTSPEAIREMETVLDRYQRGFEVAVAYLMSNDGVCVASSNRDSPDSFVGESYAFRPYFKQAISGVSGAYFALGVTSKRRGYYASAPVRDESGAVRGVIAVKCDLEEAAANLGPRTLSFFVGPDGVIFISGRRELLYRSLWPIDEQAQRRVAGSRQFGTPDFRPLLSSEILGGEVDFLNEHFYSWRQTVGKGGWSVVLLSPLRSYYLVRLMCIGITLFLSVMIVIFLTVLRQRESMLALIFAADNQRKAIIEAATHVAIVTTDNRGLVTTFNKGAERLFGFTADEAVGVINAGAFHDKAELRAYADELLRTKGEQTSGFEALLRGAQEGDVFGRDWTFRRKDGGRFTGYLTVTALKNKLGEIAGYLGIVIDISAVKRVQEELRASAQKYRVLVEHLPIVVYTAALNARRTTLYVSPQVEALIGFTRQDHMLEPDIWYERLHPEDRERVAEALKECRVTGSPFSCEYRMVARDGRTVWCRDEGQVIRGQAGDPMFMQGMITDITPEKEAEAARLESEERYRTLVESAGDPIVVVNGEGAFVMANSVAAAALGVQPSGVAGKTMWDVLPREEADRQMQQVREVLGGGADKTIENRSVMGDGEHWYNTRLHPVLIGRSGERCVMMISRDVTQRRCAEESLRSAYNDLKMLQGELVKTEKMAAVGQLAAGMAHEINNPLAFVMSNISTLQKYAGRLQQYIAAVADGGYILPEKKATLDEIGASLDLAYIRQDLPALIEQTLTGTARIQKIIQGLSAFSGVFSGMMDMIDMNSCIEVVLDAMHSRLRRRITVRKDLGVLPPVRGYKPELVRALLNVVVNAAEAVEKGGEIGIVTRAEGGQVRIEVSDTGDGIPEEIRGRIFDPFFTTKASVGGMGLGLAIAHGIVRRHEGTIEAKSDQGKGATFVITLPAAQ